MDFTLRLASEDDVLELCEIDQELFPENCFNERTLGIECAKGVCWVFANDVDIAGYALCRISGDVLTDILRLGVREPYRKMGLGTKLLRAAMSLAPRTMLCVRMQNDPAIRLYKKHGFEITGSLPQHYSWVMEFKKRAS